MICDRGCADRRRRVSIYRRLGDAQLDAGQLGDVECADYRSSDRPGRGGRGRLRGEVHGEDAAVARLAGHGDLTTQEADQLTTDRQAEAGSSIEAGGGAVTLRERLEDPLLLLRLDADAGVADHEREHRSGFRQRVHLRAPPVLREGDLQAHLAALGELERVGKQVLENLPEALPIGGERRGTLGRDLDGEVKTFSFCDVLELADKTRPQLCERDIVDLGRDGSRLDLRKVEDAVEELEQLVPRRMDHARVLDLCLGHGVLGVVLELLGKDQQAVQGCPELVRHVGDELRLVLRRDRELAGFFLDQALRLLDLVVLAFCLGVLLGQQSSLALEIGVRFP